MTTVPSKMGVTIRGGGPPSLDEVRERLTGRFEVVEDDLIRKRTKTCE